MLTRLVATGAVLGVVGVTAGSLGMASGHGGGGHDHDDHHGHTLRVLSTFDEEAFVDVGETDFSVGDQFVFSSDLSKRGKAVGRAGVACTITSVENEEAQCVGTARFSKGQITIQGLQTGEEEEPEFAITGGTGAFEGAEGTLVVEHLSETEELLTFYFD